MTNEEIRKAPSAALIRYKWRIENELLSIRQELESRDARAVDEACALETAAYEREEAADYRRRQIRDDAAIDALEGKKSK